MLTRVISVDDKRLHVFHTLHRRRDDQIVATGEQMHLHVATAQAKAASVDPAVRIRLEALRDAHAKLPRSKQQGRSIGMPKA